MFTTSQAAEYLGISEGRVRQLILSGQLVAEKNTHGWLISESSVELRKKTAKRGRPRKSDHRSVAQTYALMSRNHEVAHVTYDSGQGRFTQVEIIDTTRAPLALLGYQCQGGHMLSTLNKWWGSRAIPQSRPHIEGHLYDISELDLWQLPFRSRGLSLSDQYWVRPRESSIRWEDVNFFHNLYELGPIERSESDRWLSGVGLTSPDNTTDGQLPKRWIVNEDGRRLLLKGARDSLGREAINEVIATHMYRRLLSQDEYVEYKLARWQGNLVCACETFVDDDEEFIPAYYIQMLRKRNNNESEYSHYFEECLRMQTSASFDLLDKMLVCDSILANTDRHWGNFGIVRNVETLELRPAPIFDTGACLWSGTSLEQLQKRNLNFETRPFHENPQRQLELVVDTRWFDPKALDGFPDEVREIMNKELPLISGITDIICKGLQDRIDFVTRWHERLPKPTFVNFSDISEPVTIEWVHL